MPRVHRPSPSTPAPPSDARDAAYRVLSWQAPRFPDLLPRELDVRGLDARDSSLAHAIVAAAITRWLTLEFVLEKVSGRRLREQEPRMQAVLLGGAAQILLLDRLPPHAVLDESVEWAKRNIRPRAGGMVNAVLRKVAATRADRLETWSPERSSIPLSDGSAMGLRELELPADDRRRLGVACSLPGALLRRWEEAGLAVRELALHSLCQSPTILFTKFYRPPENTAPILHHESPDHAVFQGTHGELADLLQPRTDLWVQDPASSATVSQLRLESDPRLILDLCAGQGTKTKQLLNRFPEAKVIAAEVDGERLETLSQVFEREPRLSVMHVREISEHTAADLVLADVPCSNTGVLARRQEARYRPLKAQLQRLVPLQQEILATARSLLADGGTLLYATCSLEAEENELVAGWATGQLGLTQRRIQRIHPQGTPGDPLTVYRDGSFSAELGG